MGRVAVVVFSFHPTTQEEFYYLIELGFDVVVCENKVNPRIVRQPTRNGERHMHLLQSASQLTRSYIEYRTRQRKGEIVKKNHSGFSSAHSMILNKLLQKHLKARNVDVYGHINVIHQTFKHSWEENTEENSLLRAHRTIIIFSR